MLPDIVACFGTPFHLYDARGIRETCALFNRTFPGPEFREFFAVKALPNPAVLRLLAGQGLGFDCSSLPELSLAGMAGAAGGDICFTSNNTSPAELAAAVAVGALVNIDDGAVLDKLGALPEVPATLCVRVNPGPLAGRPHDGFLGGPESAKFGVRIDRLPQICARARQMGVRTLGLHMMLGSNSLSPEPMLRALDLLLEQADGLRADPGIDVAFINLGGGIGIPYRPHERRFELTALADGLRRRLGDWERKTGRRRPAIHFESGRYITGPHGVLATRVVNRMSKWREYAGVDACMSALMRPALYPSAYHHITAPFAGPGPGEVVDVVGSLCENNDKFAERRALPALAEGDLLLIHDTGAHGHAMGFTYNGRLRPQELLLHSDGSVELIRRAETEEDYFATLRFLPERLRPGGQAAGDRTRMLVPAR
jgi:diaminopimelate decarboxylase